MRVAFNRLASGVLAALVLSGVGCAGDAEDINRVQPGFVKKSELLGKSFYYRRTVVDAPEGLGPYAAIGSGDLFTLERIRFEIQEDFLIAYRDFEYTPNANGAVDEEYVGAPIVVFPINRHFDIVRQYNTATGEESNVIDENDVDREWFAREFMRVDWGQTEMVDNPMFWQWQRVAVDLFDVDGSPGGDYYVYEDEATNPYRARIEPAKGYLDFVNSHTMMADVGTCLTYYDFADCGNGEVRVRHAFMEVDEREEATYDPLFYPDSVALTDGAGNELSDPETGEVVRERIFDRFGYYRLERLTYDDERGLTESGRLYRILRFDIWKDSLDADGNTIPFVDREVDPIVYYLNWDFPADLVDAAAEVGSQWNETFREAVAAMQGKTVAELPACTADDRAGCFFQVRQNDCRVENLNSYLNAHDEVKDAVYADMRAAGGRDVSPENVDLLDNFCAAAEYHSRGEKNPFTWQQVGDPRFNMMVYINNKTPSGWSGYGPMLADPLSGRIVNASAYIMGWTMDSAAWSGLEYIDYLNGELSLNDLIEGQDFPDLIPDGNYDPSEFAQSSAAASMRGSDEIATAEHLASLEKRFAAIDPEKMLVELDNGEHFDARLDRVAGTSLERDYLLRTEDYLAATAGQWQPGQTIDANTQHAASRLHNLHRDHARIQASHQFLGQFAFCTHLEDELDNMLIGLAKELRDLPRKERLAELKKRMFVGVMLHEVGHNVGLRHNFEGSYDALNYHREFWNIETSGQSLEQKLDAKQPEYKMSSVMDYSSRINARNAGLGPYDTAAIKFGYGQVLETFSGAADGGKDLKEWRMMNDYRDLPAHLGSVDALYDRGNLMWDWTDPAQVEKSFVDSTLSNEVPYMFCSDEYADYTPTCRRRDIGANAREQQAGNYALYKNYFPFSNFLRGRLQIDVGRVLNRSYSIFREVGMLYQYMYLYRSMDPEFLTTPAGADMATAVAEGFNMLAEVVSMPDTGVYYECTGGAETVYYPSYLLDYDPASTNYYGQNGELCDVSGNGVLELELGPNEGLPLFLGFSEEYVSWTFTYFGTYWDKSAALDVLTFPRAQFFRVNDIEDLRVFSVSPFRVYDREVLDIMSGLIKYDRAGLSSYVEIAGDDKTVVPRQLLDPGAPMLDFDVVPEGSPESLPKIVPALARNMQRSALLLGSALLTSPLDDTLDFAKYTRVWLKGAVDDLPTWDVVPAADRAECTLPGAGLTYRSLKVANSYNLGYDFVSDCSQTVSEMMAAEANWDAAEAALETAIATDPSNAAQIEQLEEEAAIAEDSYLNLEFDVNVFEQTLQFSRLVHLIYEHGVEL